MSSIDSFYFGVGLQKEIIELFVPHSLLSFYERNWSFLLLEPTFDNETVWDIKANPTSQCVSLFRNKTGVLAPFINVQASFTHLYKFWCLARLLKANELLWIQFSNINVWVYRRYIAFEVSKKIHTLERTKSSLMHLCSAGDFRKKFYLKILVAYRHYFRVYDSAHTTDPPSP